MKDLKHLFDVLEKVLPDLTNQEPPNIPVFQGQFQPGPNMVQLQQLLVKLIDDGYSSVGPSVVTEPAQSCLASNEQEEVVQVADEIDLNRPICTAVVWTTMLNMHSLSVNVLVRNTFTLQTETILIV